MRGTGITAFTTPALLTLVLTCSAPLAGEPPAVTLPGTVQHDLRAAANDAAYRLFIGLPPAYDPDGERRYPVTYVLDGNVVFPFAVNTLRMFALFGETPETIVVGVGYPVQYFPETLALRWRDFTPTRVEALDREQSARFGVELRSGGAPAFLRFLREEAIPFVDANYRTTGDRSLWGHSLGGLFALYAMFEAPGLFQQYGVSSPSLQVGEEALWARESAYAEAHRALPARVFVSLGSEEADISTQAARLVEQLRKRNYENFALESQVFRDETHVSVFPGAFSRGVRFFHAAFGSGSETTETAPAETQ